MPKRGPEWEFYLRDDKKKNSRNYYVWCRWCIEYEKRRLLEEDNTLQGEKLLSRAKEAFHGNHPGKLISKKEKMLNHIIQCQRASEADKIKARTFKDAMKSGNRVDAFHGITNIDIGNSNAIDEDIWCPRVRKQRRIIRSSIPWFFDKDSGNTKQEMEQLMLQVMRATISAGLPENWIEDPEIVKMFALLRPTAG